MVDMFLPQTKAADDCERVRRAARVLKGKAERLIGGRTSGSSGRMKGKVERETVEEVRGRQRGELKEEKMCAGED